MGRTPDHPWSAYPKDNHDLVHGITSIIKACLQFVRGIALSPSYKAQQLHRSACPTVFWGSLMQSSMQVRKQYGILDRCSEDETSKDEMFAPC